MEVITSEKRTQKGAGGKRDRNLKTDESRGNTTDETGWLLHGLFEHQRFHPQLGR